MTEKIHPNFIWDGPGLSPFSGPDEELFKRIRDLKLEKDRANEPKPDLPDLPLDHPGVPYWDYI